MNTDTKKINKRLDSNIDTNGFEQFFDANAKSSLNAIPPASDDGSILDAILPNESVIPKPPANLDCQNKSFPTFVRCDPDLKLWLPLDAPKTFNYQDGIENYLEQTIRNAKDLSWSSGELAKKSRGQSETYHLSPTRVGLLLPFRIRRDHSVLDLGAGCGTITRYLGETAGEVVAVEGNVDRARIAALRCRDLPNVDVIVSNLQDLPVTRTFDIATMIGVLEYSAKYIKSDNPFKTALLAARRWLSECGVLVLAIENKLGLKYFAGCREDHVASHFESIEGYPSGGNVRTFGRTELQQLLTSAGFPHTKFLYPYPDYKYPKVIISPEGSAPASRGPYLYQWLGYGNSDDGSGYPAYQLFREHLVQKQLEANGLLFDMANSFLVIASSSALKLEQFADRNSLVHKYNLQRTKAFMTSVTLKQRPEGPSVVTNRLFSEVDADKGPLQIVAGDTVQIRNYENGQTLMDKILQILPNNTVDPDQELKLLLAQWHIFLKEASKHFGTEGYLPGSYWDCTPWNLLLTTKGALVSYDQEFVYHEALPIKYILFRGILYIYKRGFLHLESVYFRKKLLDRSFRAVLQHLLGLMQEQITDEEVDTFLEMEWQCSLQTITVGTLPLEDYKAYWQRIPHPDDAARTLTRLEEQNMEALKTAKEFSVTLANINRSKFWQLRSEYLRIRKFLCRS